MIRTVLKLVLFVTLIALATILGALLLEERGGATLSFGGWEATLTPFQIAMAVLLLAVALWLLISAARLLGELVRFLNGHDNAFSRGRREKAREAGLQALTQSAYALTYGDGAAALRHAEVAATSLPDRPELTHLLLAQAAEAAGDLPRAEAEWTLLARHDHTRFAGLSGLMRQKLGAGDTQMALKLAERAFALRPEHRPTQDVLLRLQAETHDWAGARMTLGAQKRSGSLPSDVHRRRDAVLALGHAADITDETHSIEAREAAIEANRLSPDLVPAAVMAARGYIAAGDTGRADRVLRKAWEAQPHPDLAAAFAEIAPTESAAERLRRFNALTTLRPEHSESRLIAAELAIAAEDFQSARNALGDLPDREPTGRSLTLRAAVARGMGEDETVVRGWLAKAVTAPRGPQWVCDQCQRIHAAWTPVCEQCRAFDTLSWRVPQVEPALPAGLETLPLLAAPAEARTLEPRPVDHASASGNRPGANEPGPVPQRVLPIALAPAAAAAEEPIVLVTVPQHDETVASREPVGGPTMTTAMGADAPTPSSATSRDETPSVVTSDSPGLVAAPTDHARPGFIERDSPSRSFLASLFGTEIAPAAPTLPEDPAHAAASPPVDLSTLYVRSAAPRPEEQNPTPRS